MLLLWAPFAINSYATISIRIVEFWVVVSNNGQPKMNTLRKISGDKQQQGNTNS